MDKLPNMNHLKRSTKPLRRSPLKRGTKPLAKISKKRQLIYDEANRKINISQKTLVSVLSDTNNLPTKFVEYPKPLKRGKTLKKTVLRRVTPKQAKRLRIQSTETKRLVAESNGICPKCHKPFTEFNPAGQHHEMHRGMGGTDDPKNKKLRCQRCHEKRHNGTAREQHPENFS